MNEDPKLHPTQVFNRPRAAVGELDGIVAFELSLDERHEVETIVAFIRMGAVALAAAPVPATAVGEQVSRAHATEIGLRVAQEIEDEARRVHAAREAAYKRRSKEKR